MDYTQHSDVVTEDLAIDRLFDLARSGETATQEFLDLDGLIISGLIRTYGGAREH